MHGLVESVDGEADIGHVELNLAMPSNDARGHDGTSVCWRYESQPT
jgi:hypothetical protein